MVFDTPVIACPYVIAASPPVRTIRSVFMPSFTSRLNLGIRLLKAPSLSLCTAVFRLLPAPSPAPKDLTFCCTWISTPSSFFQFVQSVLASRHVDAEQRL